MATRGRGRSDQAFDFKTPNTSRRINLPSTADFKPEDLTRQPDEVPVPPAHQRVPKQETGVRPARAIPYTLHVHGDVHAADDTLRMLFRNGGRAGAVFHVRSADSDATMRTYTVEPGSQLTETWGVADLGGPEYDLSVYGPNGFYRGFKGSVSGRHRANLHVRAAYYEPGNGITLEVTNRAGLELRVTLFNRYTSRATRVVLSPGEADSRSWYLTRTGGWYDFTITVDEDPAFQYVFAGHLETGEDSISDPLMGGLVEASR
jgi:phospholipase C